MVFDPNKKAENVDFKFDPVEMFDKIVFDPTKKATVVDNLFDPSMLFESYHPTKTKFKSDVKKIRSSVEVELQDSVVKNEKEPNWLKRFAIISALIIPTFGTVGYKAAEYLSNLENSVPITKVKSVFGEESAPFVTATKVKTIVGPKIKVQSIDLPDNLPNTNVDFVRKMPGTNQIMKIKNKSGIIHEIKMSKATGNQGKYIDNKGVEYILSRNNDGSYSVLNEQRMSISEQSKFFTITKDQTIISSPDADINKAINYLQKQGYEVDGILGTGAIRNATNSEVEAHKRGENPFVSESLVHPGKYFTVAGETFFRNSDGSFIETNNLQNHNPMRKTGYYTTDKGIFFLDLEGKGEIEIQNKLLQLKNDKSVISYTLAGWPLRKNGNIENINTTIGQSRTAMIFDSNNKFLATVVTPPIGFMDILTVVEAQYGNNCKVLALDGDFYSGVKLFNDKSDFNKDEMYLTHSANLLVRKVEYPKLNNFSEFKVSQTKELAKIRKKQDFNKDLFEGVRYDPVGSIKKVIYRFFGSGGK
jgi:hypothetical protein